MRLLPFIICASLFATEPTCNYGIPSNLTAKHREAKGIGYKDGYTTLEGFATPNWEREIQPFIDIRGHIFNDGRWASNAGLGSRFNLPSTWVLGGNFYYDFRDAKHLNSVHQISGGFEAFHRYFDFRLNGYYPVGHPRVSRKTPTKTKATIALPSIFGEIGFPIPTWDFLNLYFALGPYYLVERTKSDVDCGGSIGGRVRLQARIYDGIDLGVDGTFDGTFHGIAQGWIAISFPFGPGNLVKGGSRWRAWLPTDACDAEAVIRRRLQQAVYRNEIIPVCNRSKHR